MKINMYMILDALSPYYPTAYLKSEPTRRSLVYCSLQTQPDFLQGNTVLVTSADSLPQTVPDDQTGALIIVGQPPACYCQHPALDVICVEEGYSPQQIADYIQQIFCFYEEWESSLQQAVIDGAGIDKLAKLTLPLVQNDILIHDENFKIVCFAAYGNSIYDNDLYNELKTSPYFPREFVSSFMGQQNFPATFEVEGASYWRDEDYLIDSVFCNIHLPDNHLVRISIETNVTPVGDHTLAILEVLANHVRNAFINSYNRLHEPSARLIQLFEKLVEHEAVGAEELSIPLMTRGWNVDDTCLCIQISIGKELSSYSLVSVSERLQQLYNTHSCAFVHDGYIVLLQNLSQQKIHPQAFLAEFEQFLEESALYAGISRPFRNLSALHSFYLQAEASQQYGLKHWRALGENRRNSPRYCCFDQMALAYYLEYATTAMPAEHICPLPLFKLLAYDKQHSSALCETLRCYLENDCSPTRCCEKLYIHRSTFMYRLNQIRQIVQTDFENPDEKLLYLISLRLINHKTDVMGPYAQAVIAYGDLLR